ncbi:hypothetical protein Tco_0201288 [Tanacetum coccineum]
MKHSYSNDDTCFSIDVIDEILEKDFDALLDERSEIFYSIEGTILKEKLFAEFDEFMVMTPYENSESESNTEEPPFEKITFNTDYEIKTSLEEPPTDLELKPQPDNLEYVFLEEPSFLRVIISSQLYEENKNKLVSILKRHKQAFAWKITDIPKICPSFCIVYPITDSPWVSPIHCVPKKGGITVVTNERNELFPTRLLQVGEIDIEIKDMKGKENVAADHLSRIENDEASDDNEVDDNFLGETLVKINAEDEPWFADFANYFEEPYLFKVCSDAYKTPTRTTPYKLVYDKNCHLPFEIEHRAYWPLKNCNLDLIVVGEKHIFQLHELDELRHQAYENSLLYKARTKV